MSKKKKGRQIVEETLEVPISTIRPFNGQPREYFDPTELQRLADSIKEQGQLAAGIAIPVNPVGKDGVRWELTDGERRFRALKMIGRTTMRISVKRDIKTKVQQFRASLTLNFNRAGHSVLESAHAFKYLKENGVKVADIAKDVGLTPPSVYQHINILGLHPKVVAMLRPDAPPNERLSFTLCVLLLSVESKDTQLQLAQKIVQEGMSVMRARVMVNDLLFKQGKRGPQPKMSTAKARKKEFQSIEAFVTRTNDYMDFLLQKDSEDLFKVLDSRPWDERQKMLSRIDKIRRDLPRLAGLVEKTLKSKR